MPEARLERTRQAYKDVNSEVALSNPPIDRLCQKMLYKCNHRWIHLVEDCEYMCSECRKVISDLEFKLGPIEEVEGY